MSLSLISLSLAASGTLLPCLAISNEPALPANTGGTIRVADQVVLYLPVEFGEMRLVESPYEGPAPRGPAHQLRRAAERQFTVGEVTLFAWETEGLLPLGTCAVLQQASGRGWTTTSWYFDQLICVDRAAQPDALPPSPTLSIISYMPVFGEAGPSGVNQPGCDGERSQTSTDNIRVILNDLGAHPLLVRGELRRDGAPLQSRTTTSQGERSGQEVSLSFYAVDFDGLEVVITTESLLGVSGEPVSATVPAPPGGCSSVGFANLMTLLAMLLALFTRRLAHPRPKRLSIKAFASPHHNLR